MKPFPVLPQAPVLSGPLQERVLALAANAVRESCGGGGGGGPPRRADAKDGEGAGGSTFDLRAGVFVTLFHGEDLRGCIGMVEGVEPLGEAVSRLAVSAASRDTRFSPVVSEELPFLRLEITLLGPLVRLPGDPVVLLENLEPAVCGVYLKARGRSGLLLPQVAARLGWDARELLEQVSMKAGLPPTAWRDQGAVIQGFRARSVGPVSLSDLGGV